MQPEEENKTEWQQPVEQQTGAPYQAADSGRTSMESQGLEGSEEVSDQSAEPDEGADAVLRWQGPEYIEHDRGGRWYVVFAIVTLILIAAAIFLIRSWTFAILIPVMAVALFVYTRRPPAIIDYTVSRKGVHVNDRLYSYDEFRSFSVVSHAGAHSVLLVPRKRFHMGVTAYFPEEVGEALVDMLAARLPMQTHTPDSIDKLLAKLRI
jgi:hypothetical protein